MIACSSDTSAQLLYYEGFDYSSGSLSTQNGGTGFDNAWGTVGAGGSVNVQADSLLYGDLETSGGKAYLQPTATGGATITRNLDTNYNSGTVYVSFLTNLDAGTRYFGLALDSSGSEMFLTGKPTTFGSTGDWSLSNSTYLPGSPVSSGEAITLDTTALLVVRIDFNSSGTNERIRLYVNPTLETEPVSADIDLVTRSSISMNQIRLTAGYQIAGSPSSQGWVDEIRIGTDFASVTPVPEPGTFALFGLGLAAMIVLRRRIS
ncbi:MAG: PEP-CTERM sorting domain-containing protein [Terrimicrobiaceae bacterium]